MSFYHSPSQIPHPRSSIHKPLPGIAWGLNLPPFWPWAVSRSPGTPQLSELWGKQLPTIIWGRQGPSVSSFVIRMDSKCTSYWKQTQMIDFGGHHKACHHAWLFMSLWESNSGSHVFLANNSWVTPGPPQFRALFCHTGVCHCISSVEAECLKKKKILSFQGNRTLRS